MCECENVVESDDIWIVTHLLLFGIVVQHPGSEMKRPPRHFKPVSIQISPILDVR